MPTHPKCGKSWTGKRIEHCPACCETFSGTTAGDKHRIGQHGVDRRCEGPAVVGLHQDKNGVWRMPSDGYWADRAAGVDAGSGEATHGAS